MMRRILTVIIVFLAMMFPTTAQAAPADISLPLPTVTVTVPRLITVTAKVPGPTVTLPRSTITLPRVTDVVTLPRVTVTQPQVTVTKGPVQLQRVTVTKYATADITRQTVTRGATISTPPQTVTKKPEVKIKNHEIRVSVPKAVGISIGLLLAGVLLGLLGLAVVYRLGYADGEGKSNNFLREMRLLIYRR